MSSSPAEAHSGHPKSPVPPREAPGTRPKPPVYLGFLLASLVLNMFSSYWDLLGVPIGLDRVSFGIGAALLLLDREAWASTRMHLRAVHVLMLLLLTWIVVSGALHDTLTNSYGLFALLDRLVIPFAFFASAPVVFAREAHRDILLKTLMVVGLYLGVTALMETLKLWDYVWPRYIGDPDVGIQFGRARGPFGASEAMGMVSAIGAFACVVGAVKFRGMWRLVGVIGGALASAAVLESLTRSVWVGFSLGLLVAMIVSPQARRFLPVALVSAAVLVGALLAFVPGLSDSVSGRTGTVRSVYDRTNTNTAALRIVEEHPLTGVGWMKFIDVSTDMVRQSDTYPITNVRIEVHNVLLGRAAEIGLPATMAFVACIALGPWRAMLIRPRRPPTDWAHWRAMAIGAGTVWSVVILLSPTPYPLPNSLVWLIAGIALASQTRDRAHPETGQRGQETGR